jgi:excisionase family DNA binding protein
VAQQLYSVEQVADLLGLHVKTVRGYVRDGRLNAIRVGKRYRITREDLEAFTGRPLPAPARRTRHVEASSIVTVDAISPESASRLSTVVVSMSGGAYDGERLHRVETVYDEERASMKIIVIGGVAGTAELLKVISTLVEQL